MRYTLFLVAFGLIVHADVGVAAPTFCEEYARNVASQRRIDYDLHDTRAWEWHQDCGSKSARSSSSEALVIGIPTYLNADGSGERRSRRSREWCEENAHLEDELHVAVKYYDNVVTPSEKVLLACAEAQSANVTVRPALSLDGTLLTVSFTNGGSDERLLVSQPSARGDAICKLLLGPSPREDGLVNLPLGRTVTFECSRPDEIPENGLPAAQVAIASDGVRKGVLLELPPVHGRRLHSKEYKELKSELARRDAEHIAHAEFYSFWQDAGFCYVQATDSCAKGFEAGFVKTAPQGGGRASGPFGASKAEEDDEGYFNLRLCCRYEK